MATPNTRRNKNARKDDLYTTPPGAVVALLKREQFSGEIWECAAGRRHISKVLIAHGYSVIESDLTPRAAEVTQEDFLSSKRKVANIITNPPFTIAAEFLEKALELTSDKVAFFVRINFLESDSRKHLFERGTGIKRIYFFTHRLDCPKGGVHKRKRNGKPLKAGAVFYCWVVYQRGWKASPTCHWITEKI